MMKKSTNYKTILSTLFISAFVFLGCSSNSKEDSENKYEHDVPVLNEIQDMTSKPKKVEKQIDQINAKADSIRNANLKQLDGY